MMDVVQLNDLFFEAAETDRRLPPAIRKQKLTAWPEYPVDWHGYGWTQQGETLTKATAEQISRFDLALQYCLQMSLEDRRLVWAIAHSAAYRYRGAQWTKIGRLMGIKDKRIVKRKYEEALVKLYYKLKNDFPNAPK
jgi:hypothetical protein